MRGLLVVAVVVGSFGLAGAESKPELKAEAKAAPAKAPRKPIAMKPVAVKPVAMQASYRRPVVQGAPRDAAKVRVLHQQGLSAYKAGNYNNAVRKFAAAMETSPSPELIYHAAQAYRLKGERAKALDLYEKYLELAPDGPASSVCRWHVERLSATP